MQVVHIYQIKSRVQLCIMVIIKYHTHICIYILKVRDHDHNKEFIIQLNLFIILTTIFISNNHNSFISLSEVFKVIIH